MGCHFAAVISKRGLITFQHSSLEQPIAFQLFVTGLPIAFRHSSLSLCHLFFTALLYYSTPCWFTESTLVNQQGWTSESLRLNDQQGWIIWSDSPTTSLWSWRPAGVTHTVWSPKKKNKREERMKQNGRMWEMRRKLRMQKKDRVHLLKRPVTCLNKEIKDNEKLVVENDNIWLAMRVCLYKQERENLESLWDFIRLSLSIQ